MDKVLAARLDASPKPNWLGDCAVRAVYLDRGWREGVAQLVLWHEGAVSIRCGAPEHRHSFHSELRLRTHHGYRMGCAWDCDAEAQCSVLPLYCMARWRRWCQVWMGPILKMASPLASLSSLNWHPLHGASTTSSNLLKCGFVGAAVLG